MRKSVSVYLQIAPSDQFIHVGDVNEFTKTWKFIGVTLKDHYLYSNRFHELYNVIVGMNVNKDSAGLKALLTMLTKCVVLEHVLICMQSYVDYYEKINASNTQYSLVKNFLMRLNTITLEEALIDCTQLHERMQSMGSDMQMIDFECNIRKTLDSITKVLYPAVNAFYANIQKNIVKQVEKMQDLLIVYNLQNLITQCQRCKRGHTYYQHKDCQHKLCAKCAYHSLLKVKQCIVCVKIKALRDADLSDDEDSHYSIQPLSLDQRRLSRAATPAPEKIGDDDEEEGDDEQVANADESMDRNPQSQAPTEYYSSDSDDDDEDEPRDDDGDDKADDNDTQVNIFDINKNNDGKICDGDDISISHQDDNGGNYDINNDDANDLIINNNHQKILEEQKVIEEAVNIIDRSISQTDVEHCDNATDAFQDINKIINDKVVKLREKAADTLKAMHLSIEETEKASDDLMALIANATNVTASATNIDNTDILAVFDELSGHSVNNIEWQRDCRRHQ